MGLAFIELTLNQFKTIEMSCSKQFRTTERFGLDLYKVLSSGKLQISVFSIKIRRSLMKISNMRGPRIETWGIPVKIPIDLLLADPIFTFCFQFEKNTVGRISGYCYKAHMPQILQ